MCLRRPTNGPLLCGRLWLIIIEAKHAIIFDLLNEPHNVLDDDPHPLNLIGTDGSVVPSNETRLTAEQWSRWATHLTAAIREIKPDGLIMVGGVDWGFDLSGVRVDAPNIVYSIAHLFESTAKGLAQGDRKTPRDSDLGRRMGWHGPGSGIRSEPCFSDAKSWVGMDSLELE